VAKLDTGSLGSIAVSARRIVRKNQLMSDAQPTMSGHPRTRVALRGKKGIGNFLLSSKPTTRGPGRSGAVAQ
jgi:hypothetical protein